MRYSSPPFDMSLPGNLAPSMLDATPPTPGPRPELTIVVPSYNERDNVRPLVEKLDRAMAGIPYEIVYVDDDSPDGTGQRVREVAEEDPRVRLIERIGRRGLSSACVEGILSSTAPFAAVIDADMQHDETILPAMLEKARAGNLDIVVGTRYTDGGSAGEGFTPLRLFISKFSGWLANRLMRAEVSDPMSGFFLVRRSSFDEAVHRLSQRGFKILLDFFLSLPRKARFGEVPYSFKAREFGESKLDSMVAWEFGMLLLEKTVGRILPVRLVLFLIVGGTGFFVHLAMLYASLAVGASFVIASTIAVVVAMTWNFLINNILTYRDRRLKGWSFVRGLLSFFAVCSLGAVANVGVAQLVFAAEPIAWLAALAGAIVGAVWNFAATSFVTWRRT
jgi:dolichol-phosphate mannosyltransferase